MKNITLATLILALAVGTASAAETGVINQAGPYEATMQFYLHPAHGFADASEATQPPTLVAHQETQAKTPAKWIASARHWFAAKTRYSVDTKASKQS